MEQIILLLIALVSLGGIVCILYRKIPSLLALPPAERSADSFQRIGNRKLLDAAASQMRDIARLTVRQISKTEGKATDWMGQLRKEAEERASRFHPPYS